MSLDGDTKRLMEEKAAQNEETEERQIAVRQQKKSNPQQPVWNENMVSCQKITIYICSVGIVHENVKMGSDGESDQASGTSSDEVQSPVRVRMRNNHHRRISNEVREPKTHLTFILQVFKKKKKHFSGPLCSK